MPKSLKPGQYPALMELALERIGIVLWERGLADGIVETFSNYNAFYEVPADSTDDTFGDVLLRFHPDDREVLLTAQAALIARGEPYRPVCRVARPDGTYRWIQVEGVLTRDAAGVPLKMAGISWDVTALQESEARLHSVADLVPGVLFEVVRDVDNHLSLSFISQAGESLYGFPRAELMADFRKTLCRIHPDDKKRVSDSFIATADGQSVWEAEYRLVMPSGETRWLEGRAKARPVLQGRTIWCGHIVDITEKKRVEHEAEETQKRLFLALSAAEISVWRWDLASDVLRGTRHSRHSDMARGGPIKFFSTSRMLAQVVPLDRARLQAEIHRVVETRDAAPFVLDCRVSGRDGGLRTFEFRLQATWGLDGAVSGFEGVTLDITARRHEQEAFGLLNLQLQAAQKQELIGLMAAGISHDFSNLLSNIVGYTELGQLALRQGTPERLHPYLTAIQDTSERGRDLIEELLAFAGTTPDAQPNPSPQSLAALTQATLKMLRPMFPSTVTMTVHLAEGLPPVDIHPIQYQQILMNLAINARDAIAGVGELDLRVSASRLPEAICACCGEHFAGTFVVLEVADTGAGIAPDLLARIFQPLFSTKASAGGTGLGLAMVQTLTHRYGGHVRLASALGEGTTFSICFPVEGSASTTGEGEVGLAVSAPKRIRILVIDDEPEVAHFLVPLMEADAYDVSFKQDPTEALALLLADKTRCPFELVLTDQTMPGLTGMELARALLTVFPALPVVMVSGNSPATLAAARELPNIRDIVRKPFRYQELKTVLDAVLG